MVGKLSILVAHGVNLDLLGKREPKIYGSQSLKDLERTLQTFAKAVTPALGLAAVDLVFYQSNSEAHFLAEISKPWSGALINPGAWTHTSLALGDRLAALDLPFVEVHLSNLAKRESFRKQSFSAPAALGVVYGFGFDSYTAGLIGLLRHLKKD